MLAPGRDAAGGQFPPGEFVEHDLDGEGRLVPVDRPFGQNQANIIAGVIRNYRVFENFQDTNLGLLRVYGILYLVGSVSMGIGWFTFSPGITGTGLGDLLLGVFVLSWVVLYIFLPLLGIRVFTTAFNIHRGALETAGFILRRKMEREEAATAPRVGAALGGGRPGR
jgi:hypothetical protein